HRDDAFRLVTDVDEDLVLVDPDDLAVDDLPLVDGREGRLVVGNQLAVGTCGPDAVAGDRLLGVSCHTAADQYSQGFLAPRPGTRGASRPDPAPPPAPPSSRCRPSQPPGCGTLRGSRTGQSGSWPGPLGRASRRGRPPL